MTSAASGAPLEWSCDQIEQYRQLCPRYELYATSLRQVLDQAARRLAPFTIVQTRPKAVASFAEKSSANGQSATIPYINSPICAAVA
jgi:hypothetical protein